jgi:hypothetical protein
MASKKISELPASGALTGAELVEAVKGGVNVQTTAQDIADLGGGGGGAVDSVNGQTGVVVLDAGDVGADPAGSAGTVATNLSNHISDATDAHSGTAITNTPAGNIAATTVQAAINELDTLKAPLASPTFTGVPAAPTAASGTNTTQVATTAFVQQSKFVYYVNDYGLVGNSNGTTGNGTDNATALGTLVDLVIAAGGGTIRLGVGTYRYTGTLIKTGNNITVEGSGMGYSVLFCDNITVNTNAWRITGNNNHYRHCTIQSRKTFQSAGVGLGLTGNNCSAFQVEVKDSNCFGIYATNGVGISITNCVVHDCAADGIHVSVNVGRVNVIGNTVYTCADDGIGVGFEGSTTDVNVVGNNIYETSAGVAVMGYSSSGVIPAVYNINVANNNIRNTWLSGVHVHITEGSIENVNVVGNTFRNTGGFVPVSGTVMRGVGKSFGVSVMASSVTTTRTMRNIRVTNNTFYTARNSFISVGYVSQGVATVGQLRDIKISDNICQEISAVGGAGAWGFGSTGDSQNADDSLYPGIAIKNVIGDIDVSRNQIRGANMNAIRVASTGLGMFSMKDNQAFDCNTGGVTTHAYVFATTTSSTQVDATGNSHLPANGFTTGIFSVGTGTLIIDKDTPQERRNLQSGTTYTVVTNDIGKIVALSNVAARGITMPAASVWPAGKLFWVKDEAGTAGAANITMTRAGADTIDGATTNVISTNYQTRGYYSNGTNAWFTAQ